MGHLAFLVDRLDGGADGAFEVAGDLERLVREVVVPEVAPGALDCVSMMPLYVGFLVRAGCDAALT